MAVVAAATIGEGVFALPYVIQTSGWLLTLCYFIALIAVVSMAHLIYMRTLAAVNEKERLLALARRHFGPAGFWIGFFAIVVGLLLGFVAYLVLGTEFLGIIFPGIPTGAALGIFWLLLACLVWGSEGAIAWLEVVGVALISAAILFIFFSGRGIPALAGVPFAVPQDFFLPFGAVLFSLAGWTSVEQVYELVRGRGTNGGLPILKTFFVFMIGTAFAALLYWLFAIGVISTTPHVATDTVSGIAAWPSWRRDILALVGILSVAVVSLPIAREIRNAMEKDLAWNPFVSRAIIIVFPIVVVLSGFNDFLLIVSVAGGVFLSTQYLLIIAVGRRTLALSLREKVLLDIISIVFISAVIYSIYMFVVR
jgi:amino acid permease